MSTKTTARSDTSLRRRLRVLDRAHSNLNSKRSDLPQILTLDMKHPTTGEDNPPSLTDNESASESSEDAKERSEEEEEKVKVEKENEDPLHRPTVITRNLRRRSPQRDRSPMSPRSRAWYEFDLAVVVALVSPIGNWLTGGDHIKHLLLIALLIFYLHQIIEGML